MANIYQLSQELLDIFNIIEENEGELTPELEEQLNITQESFKSKIKDYTNVIKLYQKDIDSIKEEKARLNSLQKSKEKTIEKLKQIIVSAVDTFGDITKSGSKFIDYGIGKVSIRNSQVLEIDEDKINKFVNRYISGLSWYNMQNQLERSIINPDDLLRYANQNSDDEDFEDLNITKEDAAQINIDVDFRVSLQTLLESDRGFELAKALIKFNQFSTKANVDKINIKSIAKETNKLPSFATLNNNKTITIK